MSLNNDLDEIKKALNELKVAVSDQFEKSLIFKYSVKFLVFITKRIERWS